MAEPRAAGWAWDGRPKTAVRGWTGGRETDTRGGVVCGAGMLVVVAGRAGVSGSALGGDL